MGLGSCKLEFCWFVLLNENLIRKTQRYKLFAKGNIVKAFSVHLTHFSHLRRFLDPTKLSANASVHSWVWQLLPGVQLNWTSSWHSVCDMLGSDISTRSTQNAIYQHLATASCIFTTGCLFFSSCTISSRHDYHYSLTIGRQFQMDFCTWLLAIGTLQIVHRLRWVPK